MQTALSQQAPAMPANPTVAQVMDAALGTIDPLTLKAIIDYRAQQNTQAALLASTPVIAEPANAAAICAFVLANKSEPDYASAYLTLKHACQGFVASPQTNTWADVANALLALVIAVRTATPHLENL